MSVRAWLFAVALAAVGTEYSLPSHADALHGECAGCSDNGTITPTSSDPLNFGLTKSPDSGTDRLFVEILIPDNVAGADSQSFNISGTNTQNAVVASSLVSTTPWTSGQLDAYLGISASPTTPIGAFLPLTQAIDPGATGYFDYSFDFGSVTWGSLTDPTFTSTFVYPTGTVILAFEDLRKCTTRPGKVICKDDWTATANSGAILETGGTRVPEPTTLSILGVGIAGLVALRRRKKRA